MVSKNGPSRSFWSNLSISVAFLAFALVGCATHVQNMPKKNSNPGPSVKFADFKKFELLPAKLNPQYAEGNANQRAAEKIKTNLASHLKGTLKAWNEAETTATRGTLIIQPEIVELKFVSGGARFMVGAMAGSSIVVLHLHFYEKETQQKIGKAEFYTKASAMGGGMSIGATDNDMLGRIAGMAAGYVRQNYDMSVGGPTGASN